MRYDKSMGIKGFTMLELLMVIIVVGLLASLAIPQYQGFVEKARTAEGVSMIAAIRSAQEVYKLEYGTYASWYGDLEKVGYIWPGDNGYFAWIDTWGDDTCYYAGVYRNPAKGNPPQELIDGALYFAHDPDGRMGWGDGPGDYWPPWYKYSPAN